MFELDKPALDVETFLTSSGLGGRIVRLCGNRTIFSQGEAADSVFYLQSGRAKLTAVSKYGKETTIALLCAGEFVGEELFASAGVLHRGTAIATTDCTALEIGRDEMFRVMHEDRSLSTVFIKHLLVRDARNQSERVKQFFDSSEKRLARILLPMAEFGEPGKSEWLIPEITGESVAKMVGVPRSGASFFMNRFRELGLIDYDGRIRVRKALLDMNLHAHLPGGNSAQPAIIDTPRRQSKLAGGSRSSARFTT